MKTLLTIATSLALATGAVRAQDLSTYQSVINSQSPFYYNTLDNTLVPSTGTGTFSATSGSAFTSDYFGNANDAVTFAAASDQLSYATGGNIVNGSGNATVSADHGSLSLLFETPSTFGATMYLFSNGDTSPNQFAAKLVSGTLNIAINNKTFTAPTTGSAFPTLAPSTWYYVALTWDLNGTATGVNGVNYYLGQAGAASIASVGFMQRGGTGNFSSSSGELGNGGAFVLSGHQVGAGAGFAGGAVDELAAFNTELTSGQITSQFDSLIVAAPEPSTIALFSIGVLLFIWVRRSGGFKMTLKKWKIC